MKPLPPGSKLGRFEISSVLGEGAMGVVYLARDPEIERQVAVKTIRAEGGVGLPRGEMESRFLREAKLAGRLQHPNIVTIYEVGKDREVFFIAMEYVDGEPLTRFLAARADFSLSERVELVRQAASALEHAHERGVLHRDVKPGNILLTRQGRVKVADFGIGKLLTAGTTDMTRAGQLVGSPAYMSPEQIRGEKLDGRSDLFSLGVVFYELLTGSRPFPGDSITTLVYQILHTEPRDPLELRADLPRATRDVFARLLAKSPAKRTANAREFISEIRRIESKLRESEETRRLILPPPLPAASETRETEPAGHVPAAVPPPAPAPVQPRTPALVAPSSAESAPPGPPVARSPLSASLFGLAAVFIAAAVLVWIWRSTQKRGEGVSGLAVLPSAEATPAAAAAGTLPDYAPTARAQNPGATPGETLPTPGPAAAADAVVGAPRYSVRPTPGLQAVSPPSDPADTGTAPAAVPPSDGSASERQDASATAPDNVYRTKRFARFGVSPDQARLYIDGRYVGTADDWDDSGGGKEFQFAWEGVHRVRLELPGYRDLNLEVVVTSAAQEETVEIDDELDRVSRVPYPKLSSVSERTTGAVAFEVEPSDATVAQGGRALGPASSFGPSSPLRLSGPAVHDFVLSAPGRKPKTVRILVAPNAGKDLAKVELELKKE